MPPPKFTHHRGTTPPIAELRVGDAIQVLDPTVLGISPTHLGATGVVTFSAPYNTYTKTHYLELSLTNSLGGQSRVTAYGPRSVGIGFSSTPLTQFTGSVAQRVKRDYITDLKSRKRTPNHNISTTGCDPEIFTVDTSGAVIPAWKFLGAKPKSPSSSDTSTSTSAYWDGWQAEFAPQAGSCHEFLGDRIQYGLKAVLRAAQAKFPDARLSTASVLPVSTSDLETAEEKYVTFGCAPSRNAYGETPVGSGIPPRSLPIRFAGAHIHFGFNKANMDIPEMIRACDAIAGIASVALFAGMEDPQRRQFYGAAGEYREPAHGLEYRVLSPAWLCHPAIAHLMLDLTRMATGWGTWYKFIPQLADSDRIRAIINTCDVEGARALIKEVEWIYTNWASERYGSNSLPCLLTALYEGVGVIIPDPTALAENWRLKRSWTPQSHGLDCQFRYLAPNWRPKVVVGTSKSAGASA